MSSTQFWVDHFSPPDPELHARFVALTPNDCVEFLAPRGASTNEGHSCESAENRVFKFGEVVLKVYRPGRWDLPALEDELQFLHDLRDAKVPFVRPIGGVGTWRGLHYLAYEAVAEPCHPVPKVLDEASVRSLVHAIARLHEVGAKRAAPHRASYNPAALGAGCFEVICAAGLLPPSLRPRYREAVRRLVSRLEAFGAVPVQRIHGDCSSGNALWGPEGPVFMDLDDFQVGPVAIDLSLLSFPWRLDTLPADMDRRERRAIQHGRVLEIYREVRPFPPEQEALCPLLRGCRDIEFDAWFSAHWNEPGFAAHYEDDDLTDPAWWLDSIQGLEQAGR